MAPTDEATGKTRRAASRRPNGRGRQPMAENQRPERGRDSRAARIEGRRSYFPRSLPGVRVGQRRQLVPKAGVWTERPMPCAGRVWRWGLVRFSGCARGLIGWRETLLHSCRDLRLPLDGWLCDILTAREGCPSGGFWCRSGKMIHIRPDGKRWLKRHVLRRVFNSTHTTMAP